MSNLGRAGYGATNDGSWPYVYDDCDVGVLRNQTDPDTGLPTSGFRKDEGDKVRRFSSVFSFSSFPPSLPRLSRQSTRTTLTSADDVVSADDHSTTPTATSPTSKVNASPPAPAPTRTPTTPVRSSTGVTRVEGLPRSISSVQAHRRTRRQRTDPFPTFQIEATVEAAQGTGSVSQSAQVRHHSRSLLVEY
jgi:hypothetical protein